MLTLLGRGPHGLVYLARQHQPPPLVAVKLFDRSVPAPERRALQEVFDRLVILRHPAIVPILDAGVTPEGHPFTVSEFQRGPSLDNFSRRVRPSASRMLACLAEVADAVHHAHQAGLVHGHLVPENIKMPAAVLGSPGVCDVASAAVAGEPPMKSADLMAIATLVRQFVAPLSAAALAFLDHVSGTEPAEIADFLRQLAQTYESQP